MSLLGPERTPRQRLIDLLSNTRRSSYQLAQMLGIPERRVEEHLTHVVKSLARDPARRFVLEPSVCLGCGFSFRHRAKLTKPGRCPKCRREEISCPRFGIDPRPP
jgi:predicted Zn-ribbon and HTH transcriptional regulator